MNWVGKKPPKHLEAASRAFERQLERKSNEYKSSIILARLLVVHEDHFIACDGFSHWLATQFTGEVPCANTIHKCNCKKPEEIVW